jgi:hypothetical protein
LACSFGFDNVVSFVSETDPERQAAAKPMLVSMVEPAFAVTPSAPAVAVAVAIAVSVANGPDRGSNAFAPGARYSAALLPLLIVALGVDVTLPPLPKLTAIPSNISTLTNWLTALFPRNVQAVLVFSQAVLGYRRITYGS